MGNTFTIQAWGQHWLQETGDTGRSLRQVWQGESLVQALWQLWRAKRCGKYGCVTLEWR